MGREVYVDRVWPHVLQVHYPENPPPSGPELLLAGTAFQGMWCSQGIYEETANYVYNFDYICMMLSPFWLLYPFLRDREFREMRREVDAGRCQVYPMALAGATWQQFAMTDFINDRLEVWRYFPWADLGVILFIGFVLAIVEIWLGVVAGIFSILFMFVLRLAFRIRASMRFHKRVALGRAELFVCAVPGANLVSIVCDGRVFFYKNIGDLPAQVPNRLGFSSMALASTQLVALRDSDSSEEGGTLSWYLKVIYGYARSPRGDGPWSVGSKLFPVDSARVHDFQNWLADLDRRQLFRCVGATAQQQNMVQPTRAALLTPFHIPPGDMQTPLSRNNMVFTADVQRADDPLYRLSLISMSGEQAQSFKFTKQDTLADVLYRVASRPDFRDYQVKIFLSDGTQLDNMDPRMTLPKLCERAAQPMVDPAET